MGLFTSRVSRASAGGLFVAALLLSAIATTPGDAAQPAGTGRAAAPGTIAPVPYMGWNTYYGVPGLTNEALIKSEADTLVSSGLRDVGYNIVWLDAGWWSGSRDASGTITVNPAAWPDGMAGTAAYVHGLGLQIGIYTDAGRNGCGGANQGSYDHIQQDMDTIAAWGYDAVKIDWCGGSQLHLDPATTYALYSNAIANNASRRPIIFNICDFLQSGWAYGPVTGNSWRTATDIAGGPPTPVQWTNVIRNLNANAAHPEAAGPGHWNDPDYLQTGKAGITDTESRSQFSMWAMMAAPLIIGSDLRTLSATSLATLTNAEVIALDRDSLGAQGVPIGTSTLSSAQQVWSKRLAAPGTRAIALFNTGSAPAAITVNFGDADLTGPVALRDLWSHQDLGTFTTSYTTTVPSHATVVLRASGAESTAWQDTAGVFSGSPAVASQGPVSAEVFGRGPDGVLWQRTWRGDPWTTWRWNSLGGPTSGTFTGAPGATSWATGRLDVVVRGNDNHVYHLYYAGGSWSPTWESLGGTITDSPAISTQHAGQLTIFVRGTDGALWQKSWTGSSWTSWSSLGGPNGGTFVGAPAAVSWADGRVDVVVRGSDNHAYHRYYAGGSWSAGWEDLGGNLSDSPSVASRGAGTLDVYGRAADGSVERDQWTGSSWTGWHSTSGPTSGTFQGVPAVVSLGGGRVAVVTRGNDNHVYEQSLTN